MKNGICTRCGVTSIHTMVNGVVPGGSARQYIRSGNTYTAVEVVTYLCTACGYYENYVTDAGKLGQAAQNWPAVPHAG